MNASIEDIKQNLSNKRRLTREAAAKQLKLLLLTSRPKVDAVGEAGSSACTSAGNAEIELLNFLKTSQTPSVRWEQKHGALIAVKTLIEWKYQANSSDLSAALPIETVRKVAESCRSFLRDREVRVRIAAGDLAGLLCREFIDVVYGEILSEMLLEDIEQNMFLDRDPQADETEEGRALKEKLLSGQRAQEEAEMAAALAGRGTPPSSPRGGGGNSDARTSSFISTASSIYHDTAGWKTLETDVKCLSFIVTSAGPAFQKYFTRETADLILNCSVHINRFVREIALAAITSICSKVFPSSSSPSLPSTSMSEGGAPASVSVSSFTSVVSLMDIADEIVNRLVISLSDDWTEVRLAACVALRAFLLALPSEEHRKEFYPILLPRMCFNRYYHAEGIRSYSLETWILIMGRDKGPSTVADYISETARYYVSQALKAESAEQRETAMYCIGELAAKIDQKAVAPFIRLRGTGKRQRPQGAEPETAFLSLSPPLAPIPPPPTGINANYGGAAFPALPPFALKGKLSSPNSAKFTSLSRGIEEEEVHKGLLEAVVLALDDNAWSVRTAASQALRSFFERYPEDCVEMRGEMMKPLFENLGDEVWSLREDSATTIALLLQLSTPSLPAGGKEERLNAIKPLLEEGLKAAASQPDDRIKYAATSSSHISSNESLNSSINTSSSASTLSVLSEAALALAKEKRDNDYKLHTNQPTFDCCATNMDAVSRRRHRFFEELDFSGALFGVARGGSESEAPHGSHHGHDHNHDHRGHSHEQEEIEQKEYQENHKWEVTDGCVYLVRELSPISPDYICSLLPLVAEASHLQHFVHHSKLIETILSSLPVISEGVGKKKFKQYLELFLDCIVSALRSDNRLVANASRACVLSLSRQIGPNVFRGRVELYNSAYWPVIEQFVPAAVPH